MIFSKAALADWGLGYGTGAYLGEQRFGVAKSLREGRHLFEFSYGKTPGIRAGDVDQINASYIYSPWRWGLGSVSTNLLGVGVSLSRWQSAEAFLQTSDPYPEEHYYSQNRLRPALVFSHQWSFQRVQVFIDWSLLDQVLIALYNNTKYWGDSAIWSMGFGLRWFLPN